MRGHFSQPPAAETSSSSSSSSMALDPPPDPVAVTTSVPAPPPINDPSVVVVRWRVLKRQPQLLPVQSLLWQKQLLRGGGKGGRFQQIVARRPGRCVRAVAGIVAWGL
eukprot:320556-Rhodomonas_salina.2